MKIYDAQASHREIWEGRERTNNTLCEPGGESNRYLFLVVLVAKELIPGFLNDGLGIELIEAQRMANRLIGRHRSGSK